MAINRFWGQTPIAEYKPMSFQELAYAPETMYKRDEALKAQVDAMNDAKTTLASTLGEHAGSTAEFDTQYQNVLNKIYKEGATRQNMDMAKQLRQTYLSKVQPMESFIKDREQKASDFYKASLDKNNIVVGSNPLEKSFDEWRQNPQSMQFNVIGRDKMFTYGQQVAKDIKEGITKTYDKDGIRHIQTGFKSMDEAIKAYDADPQFKANVERKVADMANSSGVSGIKDAEDTIRQGVLNGVVGELKMMSLPGYGRGSSGKTAGSYGSFLRMEENPNTPLEVTDEDLELAKNDPQYEKIMNDATASVTEGKVKSYKDLTNKINELSKAGVTTYGHPTADYSTVWGGSGRYNDVNPSGEELYKLRNIKSQIDKGLKQHDSFTKTQVISFEPRALYGMLGDDDAKNVESAFDGTIRPDTEAAVLSGGLIGRAYTKQDNELLAELQPGGKASLISITPVRQLGFQGFSKTDDNTGMNRVAGTGKPISYITIKYKEDKEDKTRTIMVEPTNSMLKSYIGAIRLMYQGKNSTPEDQNVIENMGELLNSYTRRNKMRSELIKNSNPGE